MTVDWTEKNSFELEKAGELKATLHSISGMVLPLYFLFWICDLVYAPQHKWEFLALRALLVPVALIVQWGLRRIEQFRQGEWLGLLFTFAAAAIINAMIYLLKEPSTPYYAGLNLVAIGSLTFIPWSRRFFALATAAIFGPYLVIAAWQLHQESQYGVIILVHSFFIVGTLVVTFVIRMFHERLRVSEFKSRLQLNDEIANRDSIIMQKTEESLRLASLSSQFSPQVVEAIRDKKIDLTSAVHRAQICSIFIDIVNSTERVARVNKDKVHNAISMFMDDSIKILLKYDITVDKFLGDGILAFSNDPVRQRDFVARVLFAATEIRAKTIERQDFYEDNWLSPLQIKTGIAVGYANVGFYGHERYFKSYTAIGPVVNLANRLCSAAEPDKIVVSADVLELYDNSGLKIKPLGKLKLKGFESDVIKAFEVELIRGVPGFVAHSSGDCPNCNEGILQLATNDQGIYILRCRQCGHEAGGRQSSKTPRAA